MAPFSSSRKNNNNNKKKGEVYPVFLHSDDPDKPLAYINLTILDASEAVYNMVHSKISERTANKPAPKFVKEKIAKTVAKAASNKVEPKMIAKQLALKLPKKLMYKMYHKAGMKLAAQTVFIENGFVVIQLQVQHVDSMKLLATAKEHQSRAAAAASKKDGDDAEETTSTNNDDADDDDDSVTTQVVDEWIEEQKQLLTEEAASPFVTTALDAATAPKFMDCFKGTTDFKELIINVLQWMLLKLGNDSRHRQTLEGKTLPKLIQSKITENMQEMMSQKLSDKNLKAETVVVSEVEEARYFFKQLQKVRGGTPAAENVAVGENESGTGDGVS